MVVCEVGPQKEDLNFTRITVAGICIWYPVNIGMPKESLNLVKLTINSVLSRRNAHFVWFDAKNIYLHIPMDWPEYVRIKLSDTPQ